ncbi:zinc finger protein 267 [Rhipicephalus sanguineus]|uniref:zinc finger protein 267 n=1 Tax=Rhipicephalus sanguineus TaxID=34632 RepID=UPI0020C30DA0|nr:zinc finger protein 267 [Rhipicephalus sanguineus]
MPATCAAYGLPEACPAATFISFRFPSVKRDRQRREAWIRAVRRQNEDGSPWQLSEHIRLCEKHFVKGSPSNSPRHPDFVPSLFVYTDVFKKKDAFQRFSRMAARTRQRDKHRPAVSVTPVKPKQDPGAADPGAALQDVRLEMLDYNTFMQVFQCSYTYQIVSSGEENSVEVEQSDNCYSETTETTSSERPQNMQKASSKGCQTSLPMTCTQETQTQEVVEKSGTELPEAPSNCRTRDCGMTTDLTFYCKECGGTFVTAMRLYSHQRASHQNASLKKDGRLIYKCSYCSYSNYNKACHAAHEQIHGVKHAYCKLCAKRFSSIEDFETHKRIIHAEERAFKCDECGQRFKYLSSLRRHEKSHSADAVRHACPLCQKKSRDRNQLKRHMRRHTGERPFQCSHCNQSFTRLSGFRKHERTKHAP